MTGSIIYEKFYGGKWWKKLICRLFCHIWTRIVNVKIGYSKYYNVTVQIWQCVNCGVYQLWIIKEVKVKTE